MFTASGELIQSGDAYRICGQDEADKNIRLNGVLTDVRKPLISAGAVAAKDNDMFFSDTGSHILMAGSAVQRKYARQFRTF